VGSQSQDFPSSVTLQDFTYPCTAASFTPDGKSVVVASQDTQLSLAIWDLDGNLIRKWNEDSARVNDFAISPDGRRIVVLLDKRILILDFPSLEKFNEIPSDGSKLTSVNISQDSNYMLVSMSDDKIKLLEIDTGRCVQTYTDHSQRQFIIRSAFGGANEAFVISGSEGESLQRNL
jgi:WD40 repeat protein